MVLINNSCFSVARGTVNGIAQTVASTARFLGPFLGGIVFAWSEQGEHSWPFNHTFVWVVLSVLELFAISTVGRLSPEIDHKKKAPISSVSGSSST
eukprot:m.503451 g.503451  ORF g.503451 m.503451 type:complete len:96 (+) comp57347_c0_seq1:1295-1582(+)